MSEEPPPYVTGTKPEDVTRARIVDAAFECAQKYGLGRTTMADVARESRLARQTVYRYFPSKHALIAAIVFREEQRIVAVVRTAVAAQRTLEGALRAAFATCLRTLRDHPLLDKLLATEPQELLPFLTVEAAPVNLGMRLMEEIFVTRAPDAPQELRRHAADMCARAFISYAITPPGDDPDRVAASLARVVAAGLRTDRRTR
jgi:AcrR family transcriptional regulator